MQQLLLDQRALSTLRLQSQDPEVEARLAGRGCTHILRGVGGGGVECTLTRGEGPG